ncbi:WAT1-related protein At5g07050-like [Rhododendron vialii]|uniref:WAT1-related protein At5g07050-like n=1 Tax=Rhododendron vialii TaxID=182163 RepID=UPI0026605B42|nr:WAT1-related protein At5g07050-like [Rhododendron vialii]
MILSEKMQQQRSCNTFLNNCKPYFAMISLQFGYAGMNIITKVSLNRGMSHYVLVVYRHAFATAVIAPFAIFLERKARPKITFPIFMQIFILGLLGPVIDQNFYYAGLKYTSPTFSCAMSNMLSAMTFIMAVIFRMEKIDLKKVIYQVKIVGTIVTVGGAMLMTLYKGPVVEMVWSKHVHPRKSYVTDTTGTTDKDWFKGSIFLIIATFAWASLFILQKAALKHYEKHQLTLTTWVCFMGTLQAIAVTLVMEHKTSVWSIGWDMNLLAAAYAGIVTSSISYYVQGLVMKTKGPVFATAFSPLMMIIVAIMGSFILAEKIFLGGVVGSVLIIAGLYSVLWGKYREEKSRKEEKATEIPQTMMIKDAQLNDAFALKTIEAGKEADKLPSIAITLPISADTTPTKPNQEQP